MANVFKPKMNVNVSGKKLGVAFDFNTSPSKKGIVMYFIMSEPEQDPRDTQELANKISVWLQKKLGEHGIVVTYNDRNAYSQNTISFIVPIASVIDLLVNSLKA